MEELRIQGSSRGWRPGKLVCVGRNYAAHAREMKMEIPTEPMLFLKPASSLIAHGEQIVLPMMSADVHHEVELVAVIGTRARRVGRASALSHVAGLAVGLDMTARDLQQQAKERGHPWSVAKGFDTFAPIGSIMAASSFPHPLDMDVVLEVNGSVRQHGHTSDMIFPLDELVSYISHIFTLEPGDLIYTGTPEGVGPVHAGDRLVARVGTLPPLEVTVSHDRQ